MGRPTPQPETAKDLIKLWPKPGARSLAEDLIEEEGQVYAWANRNSIPVKYWFQIINAANARGIKGVTLESLTAIHTPAGSSHG